MLKFPYYVALMPRAIIAKCPHLTHTVTVECLTTATVFLGISRSCTPFFQLKTLMQAESGTICQRTGRLLSGARAGELPNFHGRMWWTNGRTLMNQGGISGLWRGACPLLLWGHSLCCFSSRPSCAHVQGSEGSREGMRSSVEGASCPTQA